MNMTDMRDKQALERSQQLLNVHAVKDIWSKEKTPLKRFATV